VPQLPDSRGKDEPRDVLHHAAARLENLAAPAHCPYAEKMVRAAPTRIGRGTGYVGAKTPAMVPSPASHR